MLCQLVCVDRRYQRMNCFNIRELQGILKRKFFTDLVNTGDSHKAVESTLLGMRHKNNTSNILLYDQSLFYNFDLTNTSKSKNYIFNPGKIYTYNNKSSYVNTILDFNMGNKVNNMNFPYLNILSDVLKNFISFIQLTTLHNILNSCLVIKYIYTSLLNSLKTNINLQSLNIKNHYNTLEDSNLSLYKSSTINYVSFDKLLPNNYAENSSS
jgi:hypothetical protein